MSLSVGTHLPATSAQVALAATGAVVIDLRSPSEFADDHLPGAHNVPLFDDLERAVIGTLYRQHSPDEAFRAGAERAAERIVDLVARVAELAEWNAPPVDYAAEVRRRTEPGIASVGGELLLQPVDVLPERAVVLHCWRGGLRSRSVVALLRDLGLDRAVALEGGYKAYRRVVREELADWAAPPSFVLRGLTGVGKTLVLRALEALRPGSTVDLEALAGHRSSILGMVGLEPVSQKRFESRLRSRLAAGFPDDVCVFEGESRKVGDVIQPASVWAALGGGTSIELVASTAHRVDVLVDDYLSRPENRAPLRAQLPFIERRLGPVRWRGELVRRLDSGDERELVELLLEHYYDPLYRHSESAYTYALRVDADDPERAAAEIATWIEFKGTQAAEVGTQ